MGRWGPTPNPSQEGNGEMGRWGPTPNPSQEGNGEMGRWGMGRWGEY
ncbi:MAG: hypothetical protein F6J94_10155 [Moorea sp. SIO1F2]|nr:MULTISPECIES: hypothetical protein [unclassified Moorena]NEO13839.1 hypothetical protein [Moorena sp. SIO3E8]NEQ03542.1 hypothetical protein [Moorena sp. SIO3F7]NET82285.1 hypothetical protein [Moorena sp. SIO1F2]